MTTKYYHATLTGNRASIEEKGLQSGWWPSRHDLGTGRCADRIYWQNNVTTVSDYAIEVVAFLFTQEDRSDIALYEVDVTGYMLYDGADGENTYEIREPVGPDRLKLVRIVPPGE